MASRHSHSAASDADYDESNGEIKKGSKASKKLREFPGADRVIDLMEREELEFAEAITIIHEPRPWCDADEVRDHLKKCTLDTTTHTLLGSVYKQLSAVKGIGEAVKWSPEIPFEGELPSYEILDALRILGSRSGGHGNIPDSLWKRLVETRLEFLIDDPATRRDVDPYWQKRLELDYSASENPDSRSGSPAPGKATMSAARRGRRAPAHPPSSSSRPRRQTRSKQAQDPEVFDEHQFDPNNIVVSDEVEARRSSERSDLEVLPDDNYLLDLGANADFDMDDGEELVEDNIRFDTETAASVIIASEAFQPILEHSVQEAALKLTEAKIVELIMSSKDIMEELNDAAYDAAQPCRTKYDATKKRIDLLEKEVREQRNDIAVQKSQIVQLETKLKSPLPRAVSATPSVGSGGSLGLRRTTGYVAKASPAPTPSTGSMSSRRTTIDLRHGKASSQTTMTTSHDTVMNVDREDVQIDEIGPSSSQEDDANAKHGASPVLPDRKRPKLHEMMSTEE
ncbi:hypothetical protein JX265_010648 [Neoarthrinium moseri]|uniref:Uncharacterized protein n=1 Tax=Neoarthrinium moseri TaxID=1658444 RepID=A0A9P9WDQ0_9PEZI|nr:hypothetical protein JX265_010648 [Neoarthrinium moseri]